MTSIQGHAGLLFGNISYQATVLADNPYIYFPMNEVITNGATAINLGSSGINGTYTVPAGDLALQPGASIVNTGGSSYAKSGITSAGMQTNSSVIIQPTYSLDMWVSLSTTTNVTPCLAEADQASRCFQFRADSGKPILINIAGSIVTTSTPATSLYGTGRHYLYAEVNRTANTAAVYVDNVLVGSVSGVGSTSAITTIMSFGCYRLTGQLPYEVNGLIGHFALYSNLLTATQQTNHWNAGK